MVKVNCMTKLVPLSTQATTTICGPDVAKLCLRQQAAKYYRYLIRGNVWFSIAYLSDFIQHIAYVLTTIKTWFYTVITSALRCFKSPTLPMSGPQSAMASCEDNTKIPYCWVYFRGINLRLIDFTQKWPVIRIAFPCHDIVMINQAWIQRQNVLGQLCSP